MSEAVQGLADTYALFGRLPDAARDEIGVELGLIGRDILALQQASVPKDTGDLEAGLSLAVLLNQLRVRVGLLGTQNRRSGKINLGSLFYGIPVDKGISAQTVVVERRRRVNGTLRTANGRKRAGDIASTYTLNVKARAAVPYIELGPDAVDSIAAQYLADFWGNTLDRAGA